MYLHDLKGKAKLAQIEGRACVVAFAQWVHLKFTKIVPNSHKLERSSNK